MSLEIAANVALVASVYLARRNSVHTWWTGMVAVSLFAVLFAGAKLYADVVLQVFFLGTCVVGWWTWRFGGEGRTELPISTLAPRQRLAALAAVALAVLFFGTVFDRFTDAALPYPDSFILGGSVVAQLLMMRRVIDHWALWIAVDVVAVVVYGSKALVLTAGVYAVLLALCVQGIIEWRRLVAEQTGGTYGVA
ncbi:nicotinamide riboside transporter PnuC [Rubrivirga sp. IMCC45206]|uniref:nicotinamide riboside transporter PnuC n=1 Tax=Rubrivirga sp. IMCC45206 TaxID=3391614 RepID=UPI0039901EB2